MPSRKCCLTQTSQALVYTPLQGTGLGNGSDFSLLAPLGLNRSGLELIYRGRNEETAISGGSNMLRTFNMMHIFLATKE